MDLRIHSQRGYKKQAFPTWMLRESFFKKIQLQGLCLEPGPAPRTRTSCCRRSRTWRLGVWRATAFEPKTNPRRPALRTPQQNRKTVRTAAYFPGVLQLSLSAHGTCVFIGIQVRAKPRHALREASWRLASTYLCAERETQERTLAFGVQTDSQTIWRAALSCRTSTVRPWPR